jgi:endonuclease VIII
MPEGHTLHRLARRHNRVLAGARVRTSSPQGRFAAGAALLDGSVLTRAEAYGKHLFWHFDTGRVLHVHLGLYGTVEEQDQPAAAPRGAVRLRTETDRLCVDLRGPTACEVLDAEGVQRIRDRLGPDPLRPDGHREEAWQRWQRRRSQSIGAALMDQSVLAGVGNVYRAEALFLHGLAPTRPASAVDGPTFAQLWASLQRLMRAGVRAGRIVTTDPADRDRRSGAARREDAHYVYRRTGLPCRRCGTPVVSATIAARTAYWCPTCQPG